MINNKKKYKVTLEVEITPKEFGALELLNQGFEAKYNTLLSLEQYIAHENRFEKRDEAECIAEYNSNNWQFLPIANMLRLEKLGLVQLDKIEYRGGYKITELGKELVKQN